MERLVIYDAHKLDCSPLHELTQHPANIVIGERPEPLTTATADETATMVAVFVTSRVDRRTLQRMPHLKLIMALSTGTDHIDRAECAKRGIIVCNVPTYGEETVAEYALALMLALSRRLPEAIQRLHDGRADHADLTGRDLSGQTLTVVGTGRIGLNVIRRARAFGMTVLGVDPFPKPAAAEEFGFEYVGLHDGLARANVISLHAPADDNRHLLNRRSLAALKPGALVINTARGELIDTTALLHALHSGHLGGAALDVIEGEDLLGGRVETAVLADGSTKNQVVREIAEHEALLRLPNVIITNHNAFNTREAQARITGTAIDSIKAFLGNVPINVVT